MVFKLDDVKNYKGPEIDLILRLANKPAIVLYLLQETWNNYNKEKRSLILRYSKMHKLHNYISSSLHSQSMSPACNAGGQGRMQQWVCFTDGNPKIMKPQSLIMICKQTCSIYYPNGEHVFIKEQRVLPILSLYFKAVPYAAPLKVIQKKKKFQRRSVSLLFKVSTCRFWWNKRHHEQEHQKGSRLHCMNEWWALGIEVGLDKKCVCIFNG